MKLTVNQAIHKFMKLLGSHYIFRIPGSNMGLIHSLMEDNHILIDVVIDPEEVK
ncbi:MAG: hypothetical protein ABIL02_00475 [candidate division WOR-3 bacterium]